MARTKKRGDIDADYHAIRARLSSLGTVSLSNPSTIPPHVHSAEEVTFEPTEGVIADSYLAGDDVQEVLEEIDSEKLARSGVQPMLGDLNMNENNIDNTVHIDIGGNTTMDGGVGSAIISAPRVISMAGDKANDEAKIENLERVVFNNEPTASQIENPSRLDMNVGVEAGVSYTPTVGRVSWDSLEDTLVMYVQSGAVLVAVIVGWAVKLAANGDAP